MFTLKSQVESARDVLFILRSQVASAKNVLNEKLG